MNAIQVCIWFVSNDNQHHMFESATCILLVTKFQKKIKNAVILQETLAAYLGKFYINQKKVIKWNSSALNKKRDEEQMAADSL